MKADVKYIIGSNGNNRLPSETLHLIGNHNNINLYHVKVKQPYRAANHLIPSLIIDGRKKMSYYESLDSSKQHLIDQHLSCIIALNETTNLTRIDSDEEARILHIEDSLSALNEMNDAPSGLYGDVGSGAGYPGIPLAIATGRRTVLIDSRQKKMKLVEKVIEELGLSEQITTYGGRAELLARREPESFSVLTARALSKLPVLMELASPLLKRGGHLICYKAHIDKTELAHAKRIQKKTGMTLLSMREFKLEGSYERSLITFEKNNKPLIKLPRKEGEAQKNPLT